MTHVDVAIAGGGIVGSSTTAYYLRKNGFTGSIAIFEQDTSFSTPARRSPGAASASSSRHREHPPVAVRPRPHPDLKQEFGADADIGFKEQGYLVLATERGVATLEENRALQVSMGPIRLIYEGAELAKRFPWINFEGIAAGSFGPKNEGWFDPLFADDDVRKAAVARDVRLVPQPVTGSRSRTR